MVGHDSPTELTAFLVGVGDDYALVDTVTERVFMINAEGAKVWREFTAGVAPRTPEAIAFIEELVGCGRISDQGMPSHAGEPQGDSRCPRILSQAPLDVEVNTSGPGLSQPMAQSKEEKVGGATSSDLP